MYHIVSIKYLFATTVISITIIITIIISYLVPPNSGSTLVKLATNLYSLMDILMEYSCPRWFCLLVFTVGRDYSLHRA